MAFVNERITDEDIEKYNLMDIWEKCIADEKVSVMGGEKPYDFAIDREREQWLIYLARVKDKTWEPRRQNYTDEHIFIFYYDNQPYEVQLIRKKYEAEFAETGHKVLLRTMRWELKSIYPEPKDSNDFKIALKEALKVYGERGLSTEETKHNIEFEF